MTRSHDRLAALVEPLVPDELEMPSRAAEWSIAQVLSHLGSGAEIFGAILVAAAAGDALPGPESFPPVWDRWNALAPAEQVSRSLAANAAFLDEVRRLSEAQRQTLRFTLFGMDLDVARFLQMRGTEHAVHTWDVAAALDDGATVAADAVELMVDTLGEMARRVGKAPGGTSRIGIVTTDPARSLVLVLDDGVSMGTDDGSPTDGRLRLPAEALLRLVYGRLDEGHTPPGVEAEGVTLDGLRAVFPGV
ncbi:MAG: maleylpyruvate isomerase family mycothiol-dependent enzyme [Acidimicrobiales bacterium]